jgi:hypothetical protein
VFAFEKLETYLKAVKEIKTCDDTRRLLYYGQWWNISDQKIKPLIVTSVDRYADQKMDIKASWYKDYETDQLDAASITASFNSAMKVLGYKDFIIIYTNRDFEDGEEEK